MVYHRPQLCSSWAPLNWDLGIINWAGESQSKAQNYLLSSNILPQPNWLPATYSKNGAEVKLHNSHNFMRRIIQSLSLFLHRGHAVRAFEILWYFHFIIATYRYDTPECKDMSSAKHYRSCRGWLIRKEDFAVLHTFEKWHQCNPIYASSLLNILID